MSKFIHIFLITVAFYVPNLVWGQTVVPTYRPAATITVSEKGDVVVKNAVVFMVSGKTIYVRTYWADSFVRWAVRSGDKTEIVKRFGGKIPVGEIKVGNILNVEGTLVSGSDSLNVDAVKIQNISLENEDAGFSGVVSRANNGTNTFVVKTSKGKEITVKVSSATTIKKGAIYIPLSGIVYGDTILSVDGIYHEPTETIQASKVEVYQTKKIFEPRNFAGVLKSLSGTELPVTAVVTVGGVDYTFYLDAKASVLTAKRANAKLQRFVIGDDVRLYGKIRETNLTEVDAEMIRNLDL